MGRSSAALSLKDSRPVRIYRYRDTWIIPRLVIVNRGVWVATGPLTFAMGTPELAAALRRAHSTEPEDIGMVDLDQFLKEHGLVTALKARSDRELRGKVMKFHLDLTRKGVLVLSERREDTAGIFRKAGRARSFRRDDFEGVAAFLVGKFAGAKPSIELPMRIPFKTGWFTIRAKDEQAVAKVLRLRRIKPATWDKGMPTAVGQNGKLFLAPPVRDQVLAVGQWCLGEGTLRSLNRLVKLLKRLSARFGEAQAFATHRVSEYCHWMRAKDGQMVRVFAFCGDTGGVILDEGRPDAVERKALKRSSPSEPGEETVFAIAAGWGVDAAQLPLKPESVGLLGEKS